MYIVKDIVCFVNYMLYIVVYLCFGLNYKMFPNLSQNNMLTCSTAKITKIKNCHMGNSY